MSPAKSDIERIQEQMRGADTIVFLYPLYWFNFPAVGKVFVDSVFTPDFAYGSNPQAALKGKNLAAIITTGGAEGDYTSE